MRDGWGDDAQYMTFDATRWGGAHSHLARNGIQLHAHGRTLLADPGFFTYAMQHAAHRGDELTNRIGPYAKSTPAHNTLNFNGWNQAPANPDFLKAHFSQDCHAVVSRYRGGYWPGWYGWWYGDGFGPGLHAIHDRILIWLPGRAAVVVDAVTRWDESKLGHAEQRDPSLEINWQLTPGPVELDADRQTLITRNDDANLMMRFPQLPANMRLDVKEGQTDPFRGWMGLGRGESRSMLDKCGVFDSPERAEWRDRPSEGGFMPAPQLCCTADPLENYNETMISVLVPFKGAQAPELDIETAEDAGQHQIRLRWGAGECDTLVWRPALGAPVGAYDTIQTDASVLHLHHEADEKTVRGTALDATYCRPHAETRRDTPGNIAFGTKLNLKGNAS